MNPQGPLYPESFKIESRRANDGYLYIGQNKFDKKGRQINDIVIQFDESTLIKNIQKENIQKQENLFLSGDCPDRLRGQHCKIFYEIESNSYKIQDLGIGLGTFLKCDNKYDKSTIFSHEKSTELHNDCIV